MNLYLISAESYHLIDNEVKKIVKDNIPLAFNMGRTSIKEVIAEASYFSLDDNKKYLVVNNATFFGNGKITDGEQDSLIKYMNNPNPNTILIFTTTEGIDARKKILKEIKTKGSLINTPKLDKRAINGLLTKYLIENEYNADYETINYIMDNCYGNLDIMINELDKIMMYYSFPGRIRYEDVTKIVGEGLDNNNFHFVNAIIEKNLALALKILNSLRIFKVEPTSLVILLAREYRLMYYVKNLYQKMNLNEIMSYLNLQDWQVNKLYNNSLKYMNNELLRNIVSLCDIDLNIKKGIWDKDVALYGFILDACS